MTTTRTRNIRQALERLGDVKTRQIIWTDADKAATIGLTDDDYVITTTEATPFGTYLLAIDKIDEETRLQARTTIIAGFAALKSEALNRGDEETGARFTAMAHKVALGWQRSDKAATR